MGNIEQYVIKNLFQTIFTLLTKMRVVAHTFAGTLASEFT